MAILDTIKKIKPLVKTATGYIHLMLSSQSVSMDNGNTLQEEIDEINNNLILYVVRSGSAYTSNNTQNWHYREWSDGSVELWWTHPAWYCKQYDSDTTFVFPVTLPNANYQVLFSKEVYSSVSNYTESHFITTTKTTSSATVHCYCPIAHTINLSLYVFCRP